MGEKLSPQARMARTVALSGGWTVAVVGSGAALVWNKVSLGDIILGLVLVGIPFSLIVVQYKFGPPTPPLGYKKRRLDWAQWQRWSYCLYLGPTFLTGFAAQAVGGAIDWIGPEHHWSRLILVAYYPILAFGLTHALISGRRGKPGSKQRRDFEGLNDELSRAHAGDAHRYGLYVAFVGLIAIAATALLAPKGVLCAVIGACWLASMTTLIKFGLLQRAAEPKSGEA